MSDEHPKAGGRARILFVDDERAILDWLAAAAGDNYEVTTAAGGEAGLEALRAGEPFAVVVSDLRMPGMSGIEFLAAARQAAPDTVRILLTGFADLENVVAAVNDGSIFRFLAKPVNLAQLGQALQAGVEQHQLVMSERVLLEQTLHGSVKALTEILALANPSAFGRAARLRQRVAALAAHCHLRDRWPVEVAAMLSQIGYVTLPPAVQEKLYAGEALTAAESEMIERAPQVAEHLLANIPRLEAVREILRLHTARYAGGEPSGEALPWGARALKIAIDFDRLESRTNAVEAHRTMCSRAGWYDPALLQAFAEVAGKQRSESVVSELPLHRISVGMVFGEDVRSSKGVLVIAKGQEVTRGLLERIRNFSPTLQIREPIRMIVPPGRV